MLRASPWNSLKDFMQNGFDESSASNLKVPPIARTVLSQMAKLRSTGDLDDQTLQRNLHRLTREELQPRGLELVIQELSNGNIRFVIEAKDGSGLCAWID